ncbi:MAG: hypothetical protein E7482_01660 [Ruminococcaceae bacterium]|nr:hypothetical protein [Oscillospiraceae bacterium]
MFKRFASIILALIMVLGVFPIGALAEENTVENRVYLQLGIFEEAFQKEISGFRNNGIEGTHIEYHFLIEDVGADELLEALQSEMDGNPSRNGGFVVELNAPGEGYGVTAITIDGEEQNLQDFVGDNGELDGLGWIRYINNGNLCNASKIYSVTWSNGSETVTDNFMVSLVFPQVPDTAAERTSFVMSNSIKQLFSIGQNRVGDRLEYYWANEESTEEEIKTALAGLNGKVMVRIEAPNETFSIAKKIGWNGTDHTSEFAEFNGDIMFFEYLDKNGNLCNYQRDFEIVWTDSTGTKEYVDKIKVILGFPQVEENQPGGEGGNGNDEEQGGIRSEATVTGGTQTPVRSEELPEDLYTYWGTGDIILEDQIKVTAPGQLANYLECSYDEYGVITVKLKNNVPASVWKEAYDQLEPNSTHLGVDIEIYAPGNYTQVATFHGNGDFGNLLEQYENNPDKVVFYKFNPEKDNVGSGYYIAQIITEEDKITIVPDGSDGLYFSALIWKNGNEVKKQILLFKYEIEEGAKTESFENLRRPAQNVLPDDRTEEENPVIKAEYDRNSGYLKYTYIGTETEDNKIAEDIMGTAGNTLSTVIVAPIGYRRADGKGENYSLGLSIDSSNYDIVGSTVSEEVEWVNDDGDMITEIITIEFDPGKTWMDIYWNPVSEDRIVYIDGKNNFVPKEELAEAGLTVNDSEGYVYSDFAANLGNVDIETIANASVILLPPDAVEREEGESIEAWVNRVYENTQYKNYAYIHNSGPNGYDPKFADAQRNAFDEREIESLEENGNDTQITVANFDKRTVNGVDVWFGENERRGYSYKVLVNWIGEGNNIVSEYFYTEQEQFYFEFTEEAKETITEKVINPTPLGKDWKLTTSNYPQVKGEGVNAYYFQLEGDENTPSGEKVIYLPYSYVDADLTYDIALEKGMSFKVHHYNDDHISIEEPIDGEATPYGIRFVVSSFSPFVIEWEEQEITEEEPDAVIDVVVPGADPDEQHRIAVDFEVKVPENLPEEYKEKYSTPEKIEKELEKAIYAENKNFGSKNSKIEFMEITLEVKTENGWVEVTKENFPKNGIEILIPYPGESGIFYDFEVAHLRDDGKIEIMDYRKTRDGLVVKVHSLSPFAVAYEEMSFSGGGKPGTGTGAGITDIVPEKGENEKNPETGAGPFVSAAMALAVISGAVAFIPGKKR